MPQAKGRRNRRERERERRRLREPGAPLSEEEETEREMRALLPQSRSSRVNPAASPSQDAIALPSTSVRISGAMVGILTILGAAYMIIAGILNGGGIDSYFSIGAGVILLAVGVFAAALSLAPLQIRNFVRRGG